MSASQLQSSPVEAKIVSILDALQNGVVTVAGQVVHYAPDIANTALMVVRIDGINDLVNLGASALAATVFTIVMYKLTKKASCNWEDGDKYFPLNMVTGIMGILTSIWAFCSVSSLINVWLWMKLFQPKLYLAHELIKSVVK